MKKNWTSPRIISELKINKTYSEMMGIFNDGGVGMMGDPLMTNTPPPPLS
jgi:hypothetical protein